MASYTAQFSPMAQALSSPSQWALSSSVYGVFATFLVAILSFLMFRSTSNEKIYDLGGFPVITAWTFFTRRYDFIREKFKESGGKAFRFRVLQVNIVVIMMKLINRCCSKISTEFYQLEESKLANSFLISRV